MEAKPVHHMPAWSYTDNAGHAHRGYVRRTFDYGGSDIVYMMVDEATGEVSMLSGMLLKSAERLYGQTCKLFTKNTI